MINIENGNSRSFYGDYLYGDKVSDKSFTWIQDSLLKSIIINSELELETFNEYDLK